jgi:hypothetical protein
LLSGFFRFSEGGAEEPITAGNCGSLMSVSKCSKTLSEDYLQLGGLKGYQSRAEYDISVSTKSIDSVVSGNGRTRPAAVTNL